METIDELLRLLRPVAGIDATRLWQWYNLAHDKKKKREIESILRLLGYTKARRDYKEEIRLPPPPVDRLTGEIEIGKVIYPDFPYAKLGLHPSELTKHMLIVGMTGTGKTNLVMQLLMQFARERIPFLIFDWKRNYSTLAGKPGFENLKVIKIADPDSDFTINPLIAPPGVNPKHWIGLIVDVLKDAFFVAHGPEYWFRKGLDEIYSSHGVYQGSKTFPTFNDLKRVLGKEYTRGREMLWMSSAKRVLAILTFSGVLGGLLNVKNHKGVDDLLGGQAVIEMDRLATIEKVFLSEAILLWIYHFMKAKGAKALNELRQVVVLEEAHHILSGNKERTVGEETIIETVIRMIREFGVGVVAVDQEPCKLSHSILSNTNTKMCMNLGSGKDMRIMAEAMNLTERERRYIDKLGVGEGIVKLKNRFVEPVYVRVAKVKD